MLNKHSTEQVQHEDAKRARSAAPEAGPAFRIIQLTDLHIFRHMEEHDWGKKVVGSL
jgi:hypothetical protein